MRNRLQSASVALLVLAAGDLALCTAAAGAAKETLTVTHVDVAPVGLEDAAWAKAKALVVACQGKEKFAGKKAVVTTKALHAGGEIYFWFTWEDATLSVTKEAWRFDGQNWSHLPGNEDRIALLFEINRIDNFASRGCAVTCHVPPMATTAKGGRFGTATVAEKGDLWHWKAARSDPAGFADDTWLTQISDKAGGRKSDSGKGGDQRNQTEDNSKPKYMLAPGKKLAKHGVLLAADAAVIAADATFKPGDTITYRMPIAPEGSVGDIEALSRWADGRWTLMLSRKLDTGNEDDVAFDTRRRYSFAMALFDDSGDQDSYDSEVVTLEFNR
jgi:hypothetical protein